MDVSSSEPTQLHTASVHPTSDASIILHPEPSEPPQGMPIPVHISRSIPPEQMSDTDLNEELQHPDHPVEDYAKEEGECTDQDEPEIPPLVNATNDEAQAKEYPPDPWNDSAFTLQERLNQIRWETLEPEPNYEEYGVSRDEEQRQEILLQVVRMHRCVDQMKSMISNSQDNLKDFLNQRAEVLFKVNQINRSVKDITHTVNDVSESQRQHQEHSQRLYDIINDMNRDKNEPQDFELLQKINDITKRMTQVSPGQESFK